MYQIYTRYYIQADLSTAENFWVLILTGTIL